MLRVVRRLGEKFECLSPITFSLQFSVEIRLDYGD